MFTLKATQQSKQLRTSSNNLMTDVRIKLSYFFELIKWKLKCLLIFILSGSIWAIPTRTQFHSTISFRSRNWTGCSAPCSAAYALNGWAWLCWVWAAVCFGWYKGHKDENSNWFIKWNINRDVIIIFCHPEMYFKCKLYCNFSRWY